MKKSTTIARIAIQAPCRNFVISTMTSTTPVTARPNALIARDCASSGAALAGSVSVRSSRVQCRIMPVWLSVNDTKTPTMYSWISRVTCGVEREISRIAKPASR